MVLDMTIVAWYNSLSAEHCQAITLMNVLGQSLKKRVGYLSADDDIEQVRYLSRNLSDIESARNLSIEDFTNTAGSLSRIGSQLSAGKAVGEGYNLTTEELAILKKLSGMSSVVADMGNVLFGNTGGSKLSQLIRSAEGSNTPIQQEAEAPKYVYAYNKDMGELYLKTGDQSAIVNVGFSFDEQRTLRAIWTSAGEETRDDSVRMRYSMSLSNPYGIHSQNRMTSWSDLVACYREDNFRIAYSKGDVRIMSCRSTGTDGEYLYVFYAKVVDGEAVEQEMFLYPAYFINNMLAFE